MQVQVNSSQVKSSKDIWKCILYGPVEQGDAVPARACSACLLHASLLDCSFTLNTQHILVHPANTFESLTGLYLHFEQSSIQRRRRWLHSVRYMYYCRHKNAPEKNDLDHGRSVPTFSVKMSEGSQGRKKASDGASAPEQVQFLPSVR